MEAPELIEEVLPNIFLIKIPLPTKAVKVANSYLIKGADRNLIIDTGFNHPTCLEAMQASLNMLGVDLKATDIFLTHYHADHSGLVQDLMTDSSTLYCSEVDFQKLFSIQINSGNNFEIFRAYLLRHGFPEAQIAKAAKHNPGFRYSPQAIPNHTALKDGDSICVGNYRFRCIATPGHTIGHMCLYEPDWRFLMAGDFVLDQMIPSVPLKNDTDNLFKDYFQSFEKVNQMDIGLVLPGHGNVFTNYREIIQELKQYYMSRVYEAFNTLKQSDKTLYQVAANMKWQWDFESWEELPPTHKLFALWDAHALLKYLEEIGLVKREIKENRPVFSMFM